MVIFCCPASPTKYYRHVKNDRRLLPIYRDIGPHCEHEAASCIRGYHIYRDIWTVAIGEELDCVRESGYMRDRYAVAVKRAGATVGHTPKNLSCLLFSIVFKDPEDHPSASNTSGATFLHSTELRNEAMQLSQDHTVPSFTV